MSRLFILKGAVAGFSRGFGGAARSLVSSKQQPRRKMESELELQLPMIGGGGDDDWIHIDDSRGSVAYNGQALAPDWNYQFGSVGGIQFGTVGRLAICVTESVSGLVQAIGQCWSEMVNGGGLATNGDKGGEEGDRNRGGRAADKKRVLGLLAAGDVIAISKRAKGMRSYSGDHRDDLAEPVRFKIPGGECKLVLQRGDLTKWKVDGETDAIVNAANEQMLGGGGVDGAIHRAAGPELMKACTALPVIERRVRCAVGMAVETPGFRLPVQRIIHTVGPIYDREAKAECAAYLKAAYSNSLKLAREKGVKYIAFPAISCGIYRYPIADAAQISIDAIKENATGFSEIHFVFFEASTGLAWLEAAKNNFNRAD